MTDPATPAYLAERAAELAAIEAAGGHLHTWPGGLDLLAECRTCGAMIDQLGHEAPGHG